MFSLERCDVLKVNNSDVFTVRKTARKLFSALCQTFCVCTNTHTHTRTHTHTPHSLNPEKDPLCALLIIDYCAVRGGEYRFLIDLFHAWEVSLTTHCHSDVFHSSTVPLVLHSTSFSSCSHTGTYHSYPTLPSLSPWPCSTARTGRRRRERVVERRRPIRDFKMLC